MMVDGAMLRDGIVGAANTVAEHKRELNEINVFPVPDGDTGANMAVTMGLAKQMVMRLSDECTVGEVSGVAAAAMLRGSRGNSGAILALLFRGFAKGLAGKVSCSAAELVAALKMGVEAAYGAVAVPAEGTILTVARECVSRAELYLRRNPETDAFAVWDFMIYIAKETIKKTPELLPVLLEEEVVDAGAKGFLYVLEGMTFAFGGNGVLMPADVCGDRNRVDVYADQDDDACGDNGAEAFVFMAENVTGEIDGDVSDIAVTYRATFEVVTGARCGESGTRRVCSSDEIRTELERIGSSVVVVENEEHGTARCQAFVDDMKEAFLLVKETGAMTHFLGTAHALTRKVRFETPVYRDDHAGMKLKYPFCTEFLVLKDAGTWNSNVYGSADGLEAAESGDCGMDRQIREFLAKLGDSIVVIDGEDMIKCHVHTDAPEKILEKKFSGGYLTEIKIDNMEM